MQQAQDYGTRHNDSCFEPGASVPDIPWLCAYTKPLKEDATEKKLFQEGTPVFLPRYERTLPNRTKQIDRLFPRYLFFKMAGERLHWGYTIRSEGGEELATALRSASGKAIVVPRSVILSILNQCAPDGVIYPPTPVTIAPGDTLRVTSGPFSELIGICARTAKDRIWLLMEIMGTQTEVQFNASAVEAA